MALPTGHWTTLAPATIKGNMALIAFRTQISNIFKCQNQIFLTLKYYQNQICTNILALFYIWMSNFLVSVMRRYRTNVSYSVCQSVSDSKNRFD